MAKPLAELVSLITPKRRWAQFSLATMLVVVTVLCVWLAVVVNRAHRQRDAVRELLALDAEIRYDIDDQDAKRPWLQEKVAELLGKDFAGNVVQVYLSPTVESFERRNRCGGANKILFASGRAINNDGLRIVAELDSLERLILGWTEIGDDGIANLTSLEHLHDLDLVNTDVTDAGLIHLKKLTSLNFLELGFTFTTKSGVAELRKALPNCKIQHQ